MSPQSSPDVDSLVEAAMRRRLVVVTLDPDDTELAEHLATSDRVQCSLGAAVEEGDFAIFYVPRPIVDVRQSARAPLASSGFRFLRRSHDRSETAPIRSRARQRASLEHRVIFKRPVKLDDLQRDSELALWRRVHRNIEEKRADKVPVPAKFARRLWYLLNYHDPNLLSYLVDQADMSEKDDLEAVLRTFPEVDTIERERIDHATALVAGSSGGLSTMHLFIAFLRLSRGGSGRHVLARLCQQMNEPIPKSGDQEMIDATLRALFPFEKSGVPIADMPEDVASGPGRIAEASDLRSLLVTARQYKEETSPKTQIHSRHILASLLTCEVGEPSLLDQLTELGFSVAELRRSLLDYIEERREKDDLDEWREILAADVDDPGLQMSNVVAHDAWTTKDSLGYRHYVQALAAAIETGAAQPPVTIAVQAPWGQGKTSLMRMLQAELDPEAIESTQKYEADTAKKAVSVHYGAFDKWLGEPAKRDKNGGIRQTGFLTGDGKHIPTVWFNPLYYQQSEQVWAGLAHAMLQQLSRRLSPIKREEFWLKLRLRRLNVDAIRHDIHIAAFTQFLPWLALWLLIGIATAVVVVAVLASLATSRIPEIAALGGGTVAGIGAAAFQYFKTFRPKFMENTVLGERFQSYVREPDYEGRRGFLQLVEEDIDKALFLLCGDYPVVVFIDDLDRCDPEVVADVVLAINQFLSLPHRNVIFVLGIDMAMVVSALEAAKEAKKFNTKLPRGTLGKSFGWHFMEKFIQLPFVLPRLQEEQAAKFMEGMFASDTNGEVTDERVKRQPSTPDDDVKRIRRATTLEEIGRHVQPPDDVSHAAPAVEKAAALQITELLKDPQTEEARKIFELARDDLEFNPRAMKRYLNVARLLSVVRIIRRHDQPRDSERRIVVRAAHLMLNWPRFLDWLQNHPDFLEDAHQKRTIDELDRILHEAATIDDWREELHKKPEPWDAQFLKDARLFCFLKKLQDEPPTLRDLVGAGLF